MSWLEKLRSKPRPFQDMVIFSSAVVFTGLVALVWAFALPSRYQTDSQTDPSPLLTDRGLFSKFFSETKTKFSEIFQPIPVASSTEAGLASATPTIPTTPTGTPPISAPPDTLSTEDIATTTSATPTIPTTPTGTPPISTPPDASSTEDIATTTKTPTINSIGL